ncbi:MAG: fluoride efflux transporter CrcB [Chloroflexi bacterium]|nr:MAG: fluoride efflux transporter CrcB [Chloroflexota bacterium]
MVKTTVGWRGSLYSRPFTTRKPSTRWIVQDDGVQYVAVAAGAMLGANLRYLVGNWAADRWGADFPYGTFLINVTGAFAIGVLLAFIGERVGVSPLWRLFFATGFLGGYTTFSSYTWEALTLAQEGEWVGAGVYILGSNLLGFVGVWLGATLARLAPL